jgi:hypothetical protein
MRNFRHFVHREEEIICKSRKVKKTGSNTPVEEVVLTGRVSLWLWRPVQEVLTTVPSFPRSLLDQLRKLQAMVIEISNKTNSNSSCVLVRMFDGRRDPFLKW